MNKTTSNFFDMSTDNQTIKDIKVKDFVNVPTKTLDIKPIIPINQLFADELSNIPSSCKGYTGIKFEEISLNYHNFSEYHYDIMNNRYLIIIYDKDNNLFKYLTHSGKVFITSDIKVIEIINSVPYPYKLSISYIPLIDSDKYKSLQLLSSVLFNFNETDSIDIIRKYLKPSIEIQSVDDYSLNYYLFTIYPKMEFIINKYNYWKYINLEQEVFDINNTVLPYDFINYDYINFLKDDYISEINNISEKLKLDTSDMENDIKFLESIYNNTDHYLTINNELINKLKYTELDSLTKKLQTVKFIDYIIENKSLPKNCIYSKTGTITSSISLVENLNFSTKTLIKCSYKDLYNKVFAFYSHNKEIKNIVSLDNNLFEELLKNEFSDEIELKFRSFLLENYIIALNLGYESDTDILQYFEKELKTIVSADDYNTIKDLYNNKLQIIKEIMDKYNSNEIINSKTKLLCHTNVKPLGIVIYEKIRLIQKSLLVELNKYCIEFNKKNKSKMEIVYFDSDSIYVIVDEEALNTAFDTLTRIMPLAFSNNCPNIVSNCIIEVLH